MQGKNVDIRVLFMAHPAPAYSILIFLEACCAVDKAICGLDTTAVASIKEWHLPQDMSAYKYLLSDEMVPFWKRELCELNNEIHSRTSNRLSVSLRIQDISKARPKLARVIDSGSGIDDTFGTRIRTYCGEENYLLPSGLFEGIFGRLELLENSLQILREGLKRSEPRGDNVISVAHANSGGNGTEGL
jgi:hypothetical protein